MNTTSHNFTLVLHTDANEDEFLDEIADALIEAGWDDATFSVRYGVPQAEFTREARSLKDAVVMAIGQSEAVPGVEVARIEFDQMLTASAIAERTGRSRQNVQQWISGERGPGEFPGPVSSVVGASVWQWTTVARWLQEKMDLSDLPTFEDFEFLSALNGVFEAHEHLSELDSAEELSTFYALLSRDLKELEKRIPEEKRGEYKYPLLSLGKQKSRA